MRHLDTSRCTTVRIIGYCELDEEGLLRRYLIEGAHSLLSLRGEYTLVIEENQDGHIELHLITSPVGAMHYFFLLHKGRIFHGDKVIDILRSSGLVWKWNWSALGDLCQLENLTANETLHPEIRRVPPGSHLSYRDGKLDIKTKPYLNTIAKQRPNPEGAIAALNDETAFWAGSTPHLSLSGGFDSRVILSSLLHQGIRPHLITMGGESSSDVKVAQAISSRFGLSHDLITINAGDVLSHGNTISALTNGTKTAWHWHTYLYPLKANINQASTFFVGTLGEFARSYYFDKGRLSKLAGLAPSKALRHFWKLKLSRHPTFLDEELSSLTSEFAQQISSSGTHTRAEKLSRLCGEEFLAGLSRYYFEQRVPNFYANGIAMYRASSRWKSPFHSRRWIDSIWNLPWSWKLGSNWHRYAIQQNHPELMEFPEENGFDRQRMLRRAPPLYWTSTMRRNTYITYDMSEGWYREPLMQGFLHEHIHYLDDIMDPSMARRIVASHFQGIDRTRTISFLLTMIHWKKVVEELNA